MYIIICYPQKNGWFLISSDSYRRYSFKNTHFDHLWSIECGSLWGTPYKSQRRTPRCSYANWTPQCGPPGLKSPDASGSCKHLRSTDPMLAGCHWVQVREHQQQNIFPPWSELRAKKFHMFHANLMALMCNQTRHHRAEADLSMPSTSVNKAGHPYHMRLAARTVAPNPTMLGLLKG